MDNLKSEENKLQGFVKIYRSFVNWEWYDDISTKVLFLHCLLKANHASNKWHGIEIQRGQFITSIRKLAIETGLTGQQVRTSLNKLKSTHEITHETTSQYSIISIKNYDLYQENNTPVNTRTTHEQHTSNTRVTTNKNNKNDKNEKKYINDPFVKNEIEIYFAEEYKKRFNNKPYILRNQKEKLQELEYSIDNFKDTIPAVLDNLKNIEFRFENKPTVHPDYIWLLKDDNYIKLLSGYYNENIEQTKERKRIIEEMEARQ